MSTYAIHFSPCGGTKQVTEILAEEFGIFEEIDLCRPVSEKRSFRKEDLCIVGVPSYGGRAACTAVERLEHYEGNGARAVLVVVYGNRAYEDTAIELYDVLKEKGFCCTAAVTAIAEHSIMHQYASGRPDEQDRRELREFAEQIRERLEQPAETELVLPGNRPYKEYHVASLKPETDGICNDCGLCVKACPVCAISSGRPGETDMEACIGCMRCVQICPSHARNVDAAKIKILSEKMEPMFRERKGNQLFF